VQDKSRIVVELPEKLKRLKPPVAKLWYRGKWNEDYFNKAVAVVGSRRMSRYGRQAVQEIVPRLVSAGYTIISGLMYGVDQYAHRVTLENGGYAVAVLGYGITRKNEDMADILAQDIVDSGGLILSEYPEETRGQVWTFPQRNRIVVGLSDLVIIVEAGIKSGSLNTASWARRMKKPVYALQGSIFSPTSEGTNWLVAEGLAKALTKQEIDKLCGGVLAKSGESVKRSGGEVWTLLKVEGALSINEIARKLGTQVGKVVAELSELEMRGAVEEERGVWKLI